MSPVEFEDVAWEDLRRFHKGKPRMYSLWYGTMLRLLWNRKMLAMALGWRC